MSGGPRYWNEETQRWEDTESRSAAPATPPPPARPYFPPAGAAAAGAGAGAGAPAYGPPVADPAGAGTQPPVPGSSEAPPASEPAGWPSPSWPPAGGPVAPASAGGARRRLVWSVLIGAAAVGVAVTLVLTFVVGTGDDGKDNRTTVADESTTPGPSEQTDVTDSSTEPPTEWTDSPSASVPELPVGYESYEDEEGFRIAIPEGWTRTPVPSSYGIAVVNYRSPDSSHRIQVYQVSEPSPAESFELYLSDETAKSAGFQELGLQTLDDGEFTGSRLEYLADSIRGEPDLGTWHVYDERFVASDGNIYAIAAYGPDSDGRDDELELLTTALDWFCPPLGACDAAAPD